MNGATAILDDSYTYDANTNVVSISDGTAGSINNRSMSYDTADRLIQTNAPNQTWLANTLSYDALDNIRSNSLGTRTYLYQYDATSKRLSQLTLPNASVVRTIGFDAQGNMSSNGAQSYANNGPELIFVLNAYLLQSLFFVIHSRCAKAHPMSVFEIHLLVPHPEYD